MSPARRSLNQQAFEKLKRDIVTGALEPGRRITEAQLAARYAMGKAPVRAALLGLSQEGFVRAIPRRGYVIHPVTMRDVQEIIQLRLLLEPTAARLAAGRIGNEELKRLEFLCRVRCQPRVKSSEPVVAAHRELHLLIARASGNQRLAAAISKLFDDIERLIHLGVSRIDSEEMAGYRPLAAALAAGDGEFAARLMVEQIELGRKRILEALLSAASDPAFEKPRKNRADLAAFARQISAVLSSASSGDLPLRVAERLSRFLRQPGLLPPEQRESSPHSYRRHCLHVDPEGRFSVVALVWQAGQSMPPHDHTCWSVIGVYQGELRETSYRYLAGDDRERRLLPMGVTHFRQGDVTYLTGAELHQLDNPTGRVTISIHVYGSPVTSIGQCYLPAQE